MKTNLVITKYFDPKYWEDFESARFRFGTLEQYRSYEDQSGRLSDKREGKAELGLFSESGRFDFTDHRGNNIKLSYSGGGVPVGYSKSFNEYVFCASEGRYDRLHHKKMLEGAQGPSVHMYRGNSNLTAYAEIELDHFVSAVAMQAIKSSDWAATTKNIHEYFLANRIEYGEPLVRHNVPEKFHLDFNNIDGRHYFRALFCKPERFAVENEIRVIIRWRAPMCLELGADARFFESDSLKLAIRRMGRFEV